jgi:cytochrome c
MKKFLAILVLSAVSSLMAADGMAIYNGKCKSCHGDNASKAALNKSQIIKGWDEAKIIASINGYKNGQGGPMKATMLGIVKPLSDEDVKAVAATIAAFK